MLQYKIKRTRLYIRHKGHTCRKQTDEVVKEMREVEKLIDRLQADEYMRKEWRIHMKKYPWKHEDIPGTDHSRLKDYGPKYHKDLHRIANKHQLLYTHDWDLLWKLLHDNITGWWD